MRLLTTRTQAMWRETCVTAAPAGPLVALELEWHCLLQARPGGVSLPKREGLEETPGRERSRKVVPLQRMFLVCSLSWMTILPIERKLILFHQKLYWECFTFDESKVKEWDLYLRRSAPAPAASPEDPQGPAAFWSARVGSWLQRENQAAVIIPTGSC